eukprot:TRINITY_DN14993_c0_g1_i1.p1 TRINITY_DN14993_c0_g1~~TRINITY_DN14993_c0_g1_i1.p1  ORF type:complete len:382 (-),score=80.61 TRINITY_DN14993_c0_g1_i1:38-1156(-)
MGDQVKTVEDLEQEQMSPHLERAVLRDVAVFERSPEEIPNIRLLFSVRDDKYTWHKQVNDTMAEMLQTDESFIKVHADKNLVQFAGAVVKIQSFTDPKNPTLGTGVFVSPNMIATVAHNLQPNGRIQIHTPHGLVDAIRSRSIEQTGKGKDPINGRNILTHFAFLQTSYTHPIFLIPQVAKEGDFGAVVGFNQQVDLENLIYFTPTKKVSDQDPTRMMMIGARLYEMMFTCFDGFNTLGVSPARVLRLAEHVAAHNGSTAKGCSGGPFISINSGPSFSFLHLGAANQYKSSDKWAPKEKWQLFEMDQRNHNLMLSVSHPDFVYAYKEIIVPELKKFSMPSAVASLIDEYLKTPIDGALALKFQDMELACKEL